MQNQYLLNEWDHHNENLYYHFSVLICQNLNNHYLFDDNCYFNRKQFPQFDLVVLIGLLDDGTLLNNLSL